MGTGRNKGRTLGAEVYGLRAEGTLSKPLTAPWLFSVPLHFSLMKAPQPVDAKSTIRIHRLRARCLAFGDCFISFFFFHFSPQGRGLGGEGVLNGRSKKKERKNTKPLKVPFKTLLENPIASMKQNCNCLKEVTAGGGSPPRPRPPPPSRRAPSCVGGSSGPPRFDTDRAPRMAPRAKHKEFLIHVSRYFIPGNFQSKVSLLNSYARGKLSLNLQRSLGEGSEVSGGSAPWLQAQSCCGLPGPPTEVICPSRVQQSHL